MGYESVRKNYSIISVSPFQNSILNQMLLYCHLLYIYICHYLEVAYLLTEFSVLDKMLLYSLIVKSGCMRQALGPGALGKPRGSGWSGWWEGGSGWGTHVNPWLFHFNVGQNSLQIKIIIIIKKKE